MNSTFTATYYVDSNEVLHDAQEYTEAGDWLDVWGNAIPAVKIEAGSYVGTGTSGASNPNTLTFPFEPKILFISPIVQGSMQNCGWVYGCQYGLITTRGTGSPTNYQINLTWGENSITWYATQSADPAAVQLNSGGITYKFVAIG